MYLNGKLVHQSASQRGYIADQDSVPNVELKGGINVLVFKVANEHADWKGSVRFTDSTGQSVHGLHLMLDPTDALTHGESLPSGKGFRTD